jgi:hypothetical protein
MVPGKPPPLRWPRRASVVLCAAVAVAVSAFPASNSAGTLTRSTTTPLRRVNVPNLAGQPFTPAIFWLGQVGMNSNYADVRVWHDDAGIHFVVHVIDRLLWHDPASSPSQLGAWDAVTVYLDTSGNPNLVPQATSYRFVNQLWDGSTVFRGNGSGWSASSTPFTASTTWRGNGPNDDEWDKGWQADFTIPYSSFGLSGPPPPGTLWALGVAVHNRNDLAGTPIPDQIWPESMNALHPDSWGQFRFGLPAYVPSTPIVSGTTTVRQGFNGAIVPDAEVGGHTICGGGVDDWTEWGNANYAGYAQINIQNQWDISDFPCFSKYYVTFPLTTVPSGRSIVSASVTLNLFGNAGYNPGDATPSAIDALIVSDDWSENSITWNNAPYATENVSVTWVYPVDASHPAGPYIWDVSYAVAEAYRDGHPLRLAFYSTAGDYHSGKYFYASDSNDWGGTIRPILEVKWGPGGTPPAAPTGVRIIRAP